MGTTKGSSFGAAVLTLSTGTLLAQLLGIAAMPAISRFYTPQDFGIFGVCVALAESLATLAGGRLDMAILIARSHKRTIHIIQLSFLLSMAFFGMIAILGWVLREPLAAWLPKQQFALAILFICFYGQLVASYQLLSQWFQRRELFRVLSLNRINRVLTMVIFTLVFGFLQWGWLGLAAGMALSQLSGCLLLLLKDRAQLKQVLRLDWLAINRSAFRFKAFPRITAVGSLLGNLTVHLPTWFLAGLFGSEFAGAYVFCQRIISAPTVLISAAIGDVFRQRAAALQRELGSLRAIFDRTATHLLAISLPVFSLIALLSGPLIPVVFGEEWTLAAKIAPILCLSAGIGFVVSPLSSMLLIRERQGLQLLWQITLLGSTIVIFAFLAHVLGPIHTLLAFSFLYSAMYLVQFGISRKLAATKLT